MEIEMSQELLRELKEMVVTCGEFKKTFLEIFKVLLLAVRWKDRKIPKLTIFAGKSFDRMYKKVEKLIKGKRSDSIIAKGDREKILEILSEYKGKDSPHKLVAVRNVIKFLSEDSVTSYGAFEEKIKEELECLYKKKEIYSNKEESKNEVELRDIICNCVSKWHDGDPIDNKKYSQIKDCLDSYKSKISGGKEDFFNVELMPMLENIAKRYERCFGLIKCFDNVVKEAMTVGNDYNTFKFNVYAKKKDGESVDCKDEKDKIDKAVNVAVVRLRRVFSLLGRAGIEDPLNNISNSFRIYSAHRGKGSKAIEELCECLLKGIDVVFCSECFYNAFIGQELRVRFLRNESVEEAEEGYKAMLQSLKGIYIRKNTGHYDISEINAFIENLKKESFNF